MKLGPSRLRQPMSKRACAGGTVIIASTKVVTQRTRSADIITMMDSLKGANHHHKQIERQHKQVSLCCGESLYSGFEFIPQMQRMDTTNAKISSNPSTTLKISRKSINAGRWHGWNRTRGSKTATHLSGLIMDNSAVWQPPTSSS